MKRIAAAFDDFRPLRGDILLCLLLTGLGAALAGFMVRESRQAAQAAQTQTQSLQRIAGAVARLREGAGRWRQDLARFHLLSDRGVLGQEHRLEWTEQVSRIQQRRQPISLEYHLSPPRLLQETGAPPGVDGVQTSISAMKLRLRLLHEGELLAFLDDLMSIDSALVRIRRCRVERADPVDAETAAAPSLQADCDVDWITLRGPADS
ncbi:hypothetical protein B9N43_07870 [Denitratisoma sp. DHT3]|uniref:hypothetical protein n=1 Tax=Denitratisoma sp. DHT3 TaxID=1981880 RepID=UPI00119861B4|nr:hypothetical protein [Denitratisoma sp. DHT3]QDX81163.1 hypothetical protein B9N43_07870 [Denitratisoma sp. DHT3]